MNNLININENGQCTARELYEFLELAPSQFARWSKSNITSNAFAEENKDFIRFDIYVEGNKTSDYKLSPEFAKKICMTSATNRGEQARNYFIEIEKKYNGQSQTTKALPQVEVDLIAAKYASEILRPSEASKIRMLTTVCRNHNVNTNFLPAYTEESLTRSATELLGEHGKPMSTITLNKRLLKLGILEEQHRNGRGNTVHKFKALTDAGLAYGKNMVSPQNEREVQVHYYPEKFKELLRMAVGA